MVHLRPLPGSHVLAENAVGAYGNVVTYAVSEDDYNRIVSQRLEQDMLRVVDTSDVATARHYSANNQLSDYLAFLVDRLTDLEPIQFHTFYNYERDDS